MTSRVVLAPLTRSEYRGAQKVRFDTQRDLDYLLMEGEPTPEAVATLTALIESLDAAIREYESRRWFGRLVVMGRGRVGTMHLSRALAEHQRRIQQLLVEN